MNGSTIKEFLVGLGFEIDEAGAKKFDSGVKAATVKVAAMGAAAVAAAGAVTAFVGAVANRLDAVSDAAIRIGTTADELMRLQYAAELSDSSAEAAASSLQNLGRVAGEAAMGTGEGVKIFEQLGIELRNADGQLKSSTALMGELGESIQGLERGEQLAIIQKLGIDPTMLQTIVNGMDQLGAEFDDIYQAAGVNLNEAAQTASDFNDALARMRMTFEAATTAIAVRLMPKIAEAFDTVRRTFVEMMPNIIAVVTPIFDVILNIGSAFIQIAGRIAQGAGMVIGWFSRLNDAVDGWAGYILAAAGAWKFLNLSFLATPIGMLLSLVAVVALLIDDFLTFREGGESLIDWGSTFGTVLKVVTGILTGVLAAIVAVKAAMMAKAAAIAIANTAMAAYKTVMLIAKGATAAFNAVMLANPIGLVIAAIVALIAIGYALITNWDSVKAWFQGLWDWFAGTFPGVADFISGAFSVAADAVLAIFDGVKAYFTGLIDFVSAGFSKVAEWGSKIKGFFGFGGDDEGSGTASTAALTPSPQAAAAVTGGQQNVNQNTEIVIQGSSDPQSTANAVAGAQNRVNADMARNMSGAAR